MNLIKNIHIPERQGIKGICSDANYGKSCEGVKVKGLKRLSHSNANKLAMAAWRVTMQVFHIESDFFSV